jgi:hypothetical protein
MATGGARGQSKAVRNMATDRPREPRARPAGAGDLSRDHGEGTVALTAPLDPVGMDENHVVAPPHSRTSRVPGFSEIGGV